MLNNTCVNIDKDRSIQPLASLDFLIHIPNYLSFDLIKQYL